MINPFLLNSEPSETTPLAKLPEYPLGDYNPFLSLVSDSSTKLNLPDAKSILYAKEPDYSPITVSTKQATPYIKKGFNVTDIDLNNPTFEQDLSDTQSRTDRFTNNLKVAGANLVSMALVTGFSNPLDMLQDSKDSLADNTIAKKIFDWSTKVAQDNYNYETKDDSSDNLWTNLNNWMPWSNSTKGIGKLLESTAYGIGAGIGIAAQEIAVSYATGGSGTLPLLARNIQKLLNNGKYLTEALKVSGIAAKGANNLKNVIQAGEITNGVSQGLTTLYRSQLGSYSEALFEGLEGKESLKAQLIDDYEKVHGFKPIGEELNKIEETATEAGASRLKINRALLSLTNLSQFNSIFKAFDARKETAETLAEKFGTNLAFKEGKTIVQDNAKYAVKSTWFDKGIGKAIKPIIEGAVNAGKKDVIYESLQEGFEEGGQFFIDKALNNYYSWKYKGDNKNISDALLEATNEVFSKEGIESIFTGALSGGGQSLILNFFKNLNKDFKLSKIKFKEGQEELAKDYNELKTKFDSLPITAKQKLYNIFNNQSIQGDLQNKIQNTNASLGVQDIKQNPQDEEQFNQVLTHELFTLAEPYVKHQNLDILNKQFDEYKNMDSESFNRLFGTDTVNQAKLVDYYKDEFSKINDAYRKANNAFNTTFNDPSANAVYNDLRKELAFSLYNNDKLINDAKTLESNLGVYNNLLYNYAVDLPTALKDNYKRIKELAPQVEYQPELSKEVDRLLKVNEYIDSVLTKGKELKKEQYIKMLQDNIINPYKVANNITEHIELDDKLNSLYYLAKIKDRINYQQDKINKILYSDDPVKFLKNAENDYHALVFNNIKESIKKETPITDTKKEPVKQDSKQVQEILNPVEQELPTVIDNDVFTEEPANTIIPPVEINIEDINEENGEKNNIESKDYQAAFLVDDDGNVLKDEQSFYNRAKVLSELIHSNTSYEDFINVLDFKYVIVNSEEEVDYPRELALYRKYPKEGIIVKHKSTIIGFIPLDDGLEVDTNLIKSINKGRISYSELLEELKLNNDLFNEIKNTKINNIPLLFNEDVYSVEELINNHNKYNKTKLWIKSFVDGNIISSEFKQEVLKNKLLDYQMFFWEKANDLIPIKNTAIYNDSVPIVNIIFDGNKNVAEFIYGDVKNKKSIELYLNSKKDDAGKIIPIEGRLVFLKTKNVNGNEGWYYINANARPAINYNEEINTTINNIDDLKDYLTKLNVQSSYTTTDDELNGYKLDYNLSAFLLDDGKLDVKIEVKLLDNNKEQVNKIKLNNVTLNIGETKKQLLSKITDSIEKGTDKFKPTTPNIFRQEATKEETNKSLDTILIPSYFKKVPSQVYSTMYLKINPLDNIKLFIEEIPSNLISEEQKKEEEINLAKAIVAYVYDSTQKGIQKDEIEFLIDELKYNIDKNRNIDVVLNKSFFWNTLDSVSYFNLLQSLKKNPSLTLEFLKNQLLGINNIKLINFKYNTEIKTPVIVEEIINTSFNTSEEIEKKRKQELNDLPLVPQSYDNSGNKNPIMIQREEEVSKLSKEINNKYDEELRLLNENLPKVSVNDLFEEPTREEIQESEINLQSVLDNIKETGYVLTDKVNQLVQKKGEQALIDNLKKKGLYSLSSINTTLLENSGIFVKGIPTLRVKPLIKATTQVSDTIKKCHNI